MVRLCLASIFYLAVYRFDFAEALPTEQIGLALFEDAGSGEGELLRGQAGPVIEELGVSPSSQLSTCTPEYKKETKHTMCLEDDTRVRKAGISPTMKMSIVDLHNSLRAHVTPPAEDLMKLYWDDDIAAVADKWAKQCLVGHDSNRVIPGYGMFIGQNVAGGHRSWHDAIMSWYNEVSLYQYGLDPSAYLGNQGWKKIGHYTQMVQNDTYRIGCGFADCMNTKYGRYYVCNYAKGQSNLSHPYTQGERCASCPNSCKRNLCDCGGKMCLNQGSLDPDTCQCTCPTLYSGSNCSQLECPLEDPFYCQRDIVTADCQVFANVPHLCPYMCGVCSTNHTVDGISPKPTEGKQPFISPYNCSYPGIRSTKDECKAYGDRGMDMSFCSSEGGKLTCDDCSRYENIKWDYCPVMCGVCDTPCGGKSCLNKGRLNPDTCVCDCDKLHTGERCQTLSCPAEEPWHCTVFPESFCRVYENVPSDCPFLCGFCPKNETMTATN